MRGPGRDGDCEGIGLGLASAEGVALAGGVGEAEEFAAAGRCGTNAAQLEAAITAMVSSPPRPNPATSAYRPLITGEQRSPRAPRYLTFFFSSRNSW